MDDKRHIVAITALIQNTKGKFLIVQRGVHEIAFPGKWALPGGKLERGETVLDTLKREVLEEVGLEIEDAHWYLRNYSFVRPDGYHVVGFVFQVYAKSEHVTISEDFQGFAWVTPEELSDYDHIPGLEEEVFLGYRSARGEI